jgi:hypothetical protein
VFCLIEQVRVRSNRRLYGVTDLLGGVARLAMIKSYSPGPRHLIVP